MAFAQEAGKHEIHPQLGVVVFLDMDRYLLHVGEQKISQESQFVTPITREVRAFCARYGLRLSRTFGDAFLLHFASTNSEEDFRKLTNLICHLRDYLATQQVSFKAAAARGPYCDIGGVEGSTLLGPAANFAGKLISICPRGTFVFSWEIPRLEPSEISYNTLTAAAEPYLRQVSVQDLSATAYPTTCGEAYDRAPVSDQSPCESREAQAQSQFNTQTKYHLIEMLKLADDKAKVIFGLSGAFLVYLFNRETPTAVLAFIHYFRYDVLLLVLHTAGILGFVVASVFSLLVIIPRTNTAYRGLIFFGSIAAWASSDAYADQIMGRSQHALEAENARHNYEMSLVSKKKYRALRRCILTTAASLALVLIAFAIEMTAAIVLKF